MSIYGFCNFLKHSSTATSFFTSSEEEVSHQGWLLHCSCFKGQILGLLLRVGPYGYHEYSARAVGHVQTACSTHLLIACVKCFRWQDVARELVLWFLAGVAMLCIGRDAFKQTFL
jgi:hypothetical protein